MGESAMSEMKRTALYEEHVKLGGKIVPFAGYEMPLGYETGTMAEHLGTRLHSGLFDVSHMGRLLFRGQNALPFLRYILTNDAGLLGLMKTQYTFLSDGEGNILDDALLYRIGEEEYLLVVNASNAEKNLLHLSKEIKAFEAKMEDVTDETGMLALQGPKSPEILENLFPGLPISALSKNGIVSGGYQGDPVFVSRTGYTGEKYGYELYVSSAVLPHIWRTLLSLGAKPCGLGARDTLRLEAGFPLYGHELGAGADGCEIPVFANPAASFGVNFSDGEREFLGASALKERKLSCRKRIYAFGLTEKGMPRAGCKVTGDGKEIGYVTSGNAVPASRGESAGTSRALRYIGLALIENTKTESGLEEGEKIEIIINNKPVVAVLQRSFPAGGGNGK